MAEMKKESIVSQVESLIKSPSISKITLFQIDSKLGKLIKNLSEATDLLNHLRLHIKEEYAELNEQARALNILKYAILIRAHHAIYDNSDSPKQIYFIKKLLDLNPSANENEYVLRVLNAAGIKDVFKKYMPAEQQSQEANNYCFEENAQQVPESPPQPAQVVEPPAAQSLKIGIISQNPASNIVIRMFRDWQDFASTPCGFVFTVGTVILSVATFIVLSQFDMAFIGGITLGCAVFGDIALGLVAGKLQKHGFFGCCGVKEDKELSYRSGADFSAVKSV